MTRTIPDMGSVPRSVAVATTDGMHFELALAYEVFGSAPAALPGRWYDVRVCGTHAVRVGRFLLEPDCGLDRLAHADTVIVPALADVDEDPPADLVDAVRAAHRPARGWSPCVRARSCSPPPACWTGCAQPRTGPTPMNWPRYPG